MPISDHARGRRVALIVIVVSNVLLLGVWPWRDGLPTDRDASDPPYTVRPNGRVSLNAGGILRNPGFWHDFLDRLHQERRVLYLGTSESVMRGNLASQLNVHGPEDVRMVCLAKAGLSPIHQCVAFASVSKHGLRVPPTVLIVNLVYFTRSHDVLNEGWLATTARSATFVQMNHDNLQQHLTGEVRDVYQRHFRARLPLYPMWMQQYLGNLLYLWFHDRQVGQANVPALPVPLFVFDGTAPTYDTNRAVPVEYVAADQMARGRWEVSQVEESVNLKALRSSLAILRNQAAPILVVVLPTNRRFYAFNGLDMKEYDRRYEAIRGAIAESAQGPNLHVLDLYDIPLDYGFMDRMHADPYGNHQLAVAVAGSTAYAEFVADVRAYYQSNLGSYRSGPTEGVRGQAGN